MQVFNTELPFAFTEEQISLQTHSSVITTMEAKCQLRSPHYRRFTKAS
jgi:hypothetical protein